MNHLCPVHLYFFKNPCVSHLLCTRLLFGTWEYIVLGILLCLVLDASLIRYEGIRAGGKVRGKITGGERKQQLMHKIWSSDEWWCHVCVKHLLHLVERYQSGNLFIEKLIALHYISSPQLLIISVQFWTGAVLNQNKEPIY